MKKRNDELEEFSCHGMKMNRREIVNASKNLPTQKKHILVSLLMKLKALIVIKPRKGNL